MGTSKQILRFKKCFLFFFFQFFVLVVLWGQQIDSVRVMGDDGFPASFIPMASSATGRIYLTDGEGFVRFNAKDIGDLDTLSFHSLFYESKKITGRELKASTNGLLLPVWTQDLEAVIVVPADYAENLMKKMSFSFAARYNRDYVAKMTYLRTVECMGRYREFAGYQGIFASFNFNQKEDNISFEDANNMNYWAPLTVMRSHPFAPVSNEILENYSVHFSDGPRRWNKNELAVEYINSSSGEAQTCLTHKRAMEKYSPLNPKQIKNFSYRIHGTEDNGEVIIIHFRTLDRAYPRKTRIYGQGWLYCRPATGLIEKVVIENHQDAYSIFPRKKMDSLFPSATQHRLEIGYAMQRGKIHTKYVSLDVNWIDPEIKTFFYRINIQGRKNPIENKLREYEYFEFSDIISVNKQEKEKIEAIMRPGGGDYYCAPFFESRWRQLPRRANIDRGRLERELNINGETLANQAGQNGEYIEYYLINTPAERFPWIKKYSTDSRNKLYPLIYRQSYDIDN